MHVIVLLDLILNNKGYTVYAFQSSFDYSVGAELRLYRNVFVRRAGTDQIAGPFNSAYEAASYLKGGGFTDDRHDVVVTYPETDMTNLVHVDFQKKRRCITIKTLEILTT